LKIGVVHSGEGVGVVETREQARIGDVYKRVNSIMGEWQTKVKWTYELNKIGYIRILISLCKQTSNDHEELMSLPINP